jgi:quercetin dioxygenase-like cupin family protein
MKTTVRLERSYDVARLERDLDTAIHAGEFILNRPTYHDGGWRALALVAVDGQTDAKALRWAGEQANYRKTPILAKCPYFEEIIDGFECPVQRVRLLRLEPGAKIHEHVDLGDGWAMKRVRLHIPIVTHEKVFFYVDGQRVTMMPGQLWYCDFTKPHRVHNQSDIGRVHLVLDMTVDGWLRDQFPPEPVAERVAGYAKYARFHGRARIKETLRKTGVSAFAKRLMGKPVAAPAPVVDKFD